MANIVADSIYGTKRIVTIEAQYPRFIHGEVMTHRVFSRNAMSSRAIPVAKMIEQVRSNPAMPIHWGANQAGMQAAEEHSAAVLVPRFYELDNPADAPIFEYLVAPMTVQAAWGEAANNAADIAEAMANAGYHKQVVNRILEPFQWMRTLITSTEWDNFFELRCHPDAQPEFQHLAHMMRAAIESSTPVARLPVEGAPDSWHLPYVRDAERRLFRTDVLLKLSTARCARVSYLTHDGLNPDVDQDLALYERLVGSTPIHASPCEHQAFPAKFSTDTSRNFRGWVQHRESVERSLATS